MNDPRDRTPTPEEIEMDRALREKMVRLGDVLAVCDYLGKELQGVPKNYRKLAVARLMNKSRDLVKQGHPLGAMIFATVAHSWDEFEQ